MEEYSDHDHMADDVTNQARVQRLHQEQQADYARRLAAARDRAGSVSVSASEQYDTTAITIAEWRERTGRGPSEDPQF